MDAPIWTLVTLIGLGAFHGVNPGMGWLFAVALGLQDGDRRTVWASLLPLAAGHALAIVVAVAAVGLVGLFIPLRIVKWVVAVVLFLFGCSKLLRNRHPRYGGMRVGARQLTMWSFLMACAHGAGLMVIPLLLGSGSAGSGVTVPATTVYETTNDGVVHNHHHDDHDGMMMSSSNVDTRVHDAGSQEAHGRHASLAGALPGGLSGAFVVVLFHTLGYLLVTGLTAVVVFERVGLRMLRSAWFNIDIVWAASLVLTALLTVLL